MPQNIRKLIQAIERLRELATEGGLTDGRPLNEKINSAVSKVQEHLTNTAGPEPLTHEPLPISREEYEELNLRLSQHYLTMAQRIWNISLISLPLDLLILTTFAQPAINPVSEVFFEELILFVLALGLIAGFKDPLLRVMSSLQDSQTDAGARTDQYSVVAIGLVVIAVLGQALLTSAQMGWLPVALVIGSFLISAPSWGKSVQRTRQYYHQLSVDRRFWIERATQQVFVLNLIPIVSARLASFLAAWSVAIGTLPITRYYLYGSVGFVFLLSLFPEKQDFLIPCKRCAAWTSRIFKSHQACPTCEARARIALPTTVGIGQSQKERSLRIKEFLKEQQLVQAERSHLKKKGPLSIWESSA